MHGIKLLAFILFSCNLFAMIPKSFFYSVVDISYKNEHYINTNLDIKSPINTWVTLLKLKKVNENYHLENHCIFYKTPYKKRRGVLKIVKVEKDCNFEYREARGLVYKDISSLKINIDKNKMILSRNNKPLHIIFNNMQTKKRPERFDSSAENGLIMLAKANHKSKIKTPGEVINDFIKGELTSCHLHSNKCEETMSFECENICPSGWYEVPIADCPHLYNRYCGRSNCGVKNGPACPRGWKWTTKLKVECKGEHSAGFCKKGLKIFCNERRELICL